MQQLSHVNGQEADEAAIRTLFTQLNEAWGNTDAFAAVFTEDADYITFDGTHTKGKAAIAQVHRPLFEGFMKGSRLSGNIQDMRFLAPDVALLHTTGRIIQKHQKRPSRRSLSTQTMVAVKQEDRWLFTAFQNTRYRPFNKTLFGRLLTLVARPASGSEKTLSTSSKM
ncbi:SgcJ/EcaC family oxidoreductase [Dictyobacter formicarum]|uniref:DUF4440 domain-containing protein n=1 Tax=Dictyobacter formicarum TaxID=2778368 RepID=A0ABQ3VNX2_9CHLR|nr:SgcJ/EcaC family oxidoreductase [Dictyobacter formicarum]GHO87508.1 hypothetical protein KSZ_55140 [Dictyobacter formicarum]